MRGRVHTIVPAAGSALRMGLGYSKAYLEMAGKPMLVRTVESLLRSQHIDRIVTAVRPDEVDLCREEVVARYGLVDRMEVIGGGTERNRTVWELLSAAPADRDLVLIHDGARPFVTEHIVAEVLSATVQWGAAVAAVPVTDTVKFSEDGGESVSSTLDRDKIWLAQTPQAFHRDLIISAHRRARKDDVPVTDDATLVEMAGHPVRIVKGDRRNIKITTLEDLELARWILRNQGGDS